MSEKPLVMVVDDDLAMCGVLRAFLGARGYSALAITSAEEAIRRFHAERPDAVLLDMVMPGGMDGLAALAAFKKIDKDIPVIILSGQGHTNTIVQAMKLGAADFVCKPYEDAELEVLMANALKQRHLSREVATLRQQLSEQSKHTMLFGNSERMTSHAFEFVLDAELKRAVRSQNYLTLLVVEAKREWDGLMVTADDGTVGEVAKIQRADLRARSRGSHRRRQP